MSSERTVPVLVRDYACNSHVHGAWYSAARCHSSSRSLLTAWTGSETAYLQHLERERPSHACRPPPSIPPPPCEEDGSVKLFTLFADTRTARQCALRSKSSVWRRQFIQSELHAGTAMHQSIHLCLLQSAHSIHGRPLMLHNTLCRHEETAHRRHHSSIHSI